MNSSTLQLVSNIIQAKSSNFHKRAAKSSFDRFEERFVATAGFFLITLYLYLRITGQSHVLEHEKAVFLQSKETIDQFFQSTLSTFQVTKFEEIKLESFNINIFEGTDWETMIEEERKQYSNDEIERRIQKTVNLIDQQHAIMKELDQNIRECSEKEIRLHHSSSYSYSGNCFRDFSVLFFGNLRIFTKDPSKRAGILEKLDSIYWKSIINFLNSRVKTQTRKIIKSSHQLSKASHRIQNLIEILSKLTLDPEPSKFILTVKEKCEKLQQKIQTTESIIENIFKGLLTHIVELKEYEPKPDATTIITDETNDWTKIDNLFAKFYS